MIGVAAVRQPQDLVGEQTLNRPGAATELRAAVASDLSLANRVEVQKLRRELIGGLAPKPR